MTHLSALLSSILLLVAYANAEKTLVLLENTAVKETHSIFFGKLKDAGFELTFKTADDASLALTKYGDYLFKHLIVFAPSVEEFGGSIDVAAITSFVDNGGNVLVAGSSSIGQPIRDLASECGMEYDEEKTFVIDHHHFDVSDEGKHNTILADPRNIIKNAEKIVKSGTTSPIVFQGVGMTADPENSLVLEILTASSTAYSYSPDNAISEYPLAVGKNTVLVGGQQARNNARIVFAGSLDMFSDRYFMSPAQNAVSSGSELFPKSGNMAFCMDVAMWTFKKNGVLRVQEVQHYLAADKTVPAAYTIEEDVVYNIVIEELVEGKWVPFQNKDVQLEFFRIDPFVRMYLTPSPAGVFTAEFKLPDVYGVFKYKVDYSRVGYTHLFNVAQVSVRPKTHTQYERFIASAYPYYASAFSMMFGVCLFSMVFLHNRDEKKIKDE